MARQHTGLQDELRANGHVPDGWYCVRWQDRWVDVRWYGADGALVEGKETEGGT